MNKKAIAPVVATVLLVLVVITAVGIVWSALRPVINIGTVMSEACLKARVTVDTALGFSCYNSTSGNTLVMIKRGSEDFELSAVQMGVLAAGKLTTYTARPNVAGTVSGVTMEGQAFTYTLAVNDFPGINEARTYLINSSTLGTVNKIQVAPYVRVTGGRAERLCDITSEASISSC